MTAHANDTPDVRSIARAKGNSRVRQTRVATILSQLSRPTGATVAQLQKVTGWQPHSIRATLTGLRKQGHAVVRGKNTKGVTIYLVATSA